MKLRSRLTLAVAVFLMCAPLFAGLSWQATSIAKHGSEESTTSMLGSAQNGNVREEFVSVPKGTKGLAKQGSWWLYLGDSNSVYIVDPEEKTYMRVNIDSMLSFTGAVTQLMQMKISNVKVEVKDLGNELVAGYQCQHISISSAYDMEMKVMIMKVKSHVASTRELWGTKDISAADLAGAFTRKSFRTGMKDLDSLIQIQTEPYKDIGFVVRSIVTETTTDPKGKSDVRTTETTFTEVTTKTLDNELFKIPEGYTKIDWSGLIERKDE